MRTDTLVETCGNFGIWRSTFALDHRVGESAPTFLVGRIAPDGGSCGGPQDACRTLAVARDVAGKRAKRESKCSRCGQARKCFALGGCE